MLPRLPKGSGTPVPVSHLLSFLLGLLFSCQTLTDYKPHRVFQRLTGYSASCISAFLYPSRKLYNRPHISAVWLRGPQQAHEHGPLSSFFLPSCLALPAPSLLLLGSSSNTLLCLWPPTDGVLTGQRQLLRLRHSRRAGHPGVLGPPAPCPLILLSPQALGCCPLCDKQGSQSTELTTYLTSETRNCQRLGSVPGLPDSKSLSPPP